MWCPRRSANRSKDRRQLPSRLDYLATFHRHTASFTTASSPPSPPSPSSEALWQRSSLGCYRFPPIALSNSVASRTNPRFRSKSLSLPKNYDPQSAYPEISRYAVALLLQNLSENVASSVSSCLRKERSYILSRIP